MWEPQHLTTVRAATACYRDTFNTLKSDLTPSVKFPFVIRWGTAFCDGIQTCSSGDVAAEGLLRRTGPAIEADFRVRHV
jgi:hypothetical protein